MRIALAALALAGVSCASVFRPPKTTLQLAETFPVETSLQQGDLLEAYQVWPQMIDGAIRSLDIAQFYVSNREGSRLEPVLVAVENAAARGVKVRLLADAKFAKTYPESLDRLAKRGVAVRRFDAAKLRGGGVLHAKYFIVDGSELYLGSQNFDWRSLEENEELGVRVSAPNTALALVRLFENDWAIAGGEPRPVLPPGALPISFPEEVSTVIAYDQAALQLAGPSLETPRITPVASPNVGLPDGLAWDLPLLVRAIDSAQGSICIELLTYKATGRDGKPFLDLDQALRRAAARGVRVRLLLSDWCKRAGTIEGLKELARVSGVEIRLVTIPLAAEGFIPFARCAHSKYMVVDGGLTWIGTSNWEGDYFFESRNVGLFIDGRHVAWRLEGLFETIWGGPYAERVDPDKTYVAPRISAAW